jgi:hypothetical protein
MDIGRCFVKGKGIMQVYSLPVTNSTTVPLYLRVSETTGESEPRNIFRRLMVQNTVDEGSFQANRSAHFQVGQVARTATLKKKTIPPVNKAVSTKWSAKDLLINRRRPSITYSISSIRDSTQNQQIQTADKLAEARISQPSIVSSAAVEKYEDLDDEEETAYYTNTVLKVDQKSPLEIAIEKVETREDVASNIHR